jgi:hypothetical protein
MRPYSDLPIQCRADIDECVIAYDAGGKNLASKVFRAMCEARKLRVYERVMLGDQVRNRLTILGLLPIGA